MKKNLYVIGIIFLLATLFYLELTSVSTPDTTIGGRNSDVMFVME